MDFPALPSRSRYILPVILVLPLLLGLLGLGVVVAPTTVRYRVTAERVEVQAGLGPLDQSRSFSRSELRDPRVVSLAGGRRTNGTGKPGYCEGTWRYPELGSVWQATTCASTGVVFEAGAERVVVSPADPEGLVRLLQEPGSSAEVAAATAPESSNTWMWVLALPFLALGAVPWLAWRLSRPMVYRIEGDSLAVPAHFAPVVLPLPGARFTRRPLGRAWRVAGAGLPGLYLGSFREGGRGLHVAATDSKRGVMIEGERRVYVTPEDLEAFVAAIRAVGAEEVPASA